MLLRLAHIIFAFLLFVASTGLVLNKHYCRNELKSTALFSKAEACHTGKMKADCPMHTGSDPASEKERKDCCDDQTEYLKVEEDQILPSFEIDLQKIIPVITIAYLSKKSMAYIIDRLTTHYLNYKPPLIVCDLSIRFQTFLC